MTGCLEALSVRRVAGKRASAPSWPSCPAERSKMSKRKNEQRSGGDGECHVSKTKRSFREDPEVTDGLDVTRQTQITDSKGKSKPTMGAAEDSEERDQGSTESSEANSQASSNDEGKTTASERSQVKRFTSISLSQNSAGKFVPVFTKPKEASTEKRKRNNGVAPRSRTEQEVTDYKPQNTESSLEGKLSEATTPEARSQAEALEQANLIVVRMEEDLSEATPECQRSVCEELDNPQTCRRMKNISNGAENDLVPPEQQGEGTACRLQEDSCEKSPLIETTSVFPYTPDKSIGNCQERSLSAELSGCHQGKEINSNNQIEDQGKADCNNGLLCASVANVEQNKPDAVLDSGVKGEESSKDVNGEQQSVTETEGENEMTENITESSLKNTAATENDCRAQESAGNQSRGIGAAQRSAPRGEGSAAPPTDPGSGAKAAEAGGPRGSGGTEPGSPPCGGGEAGGHGRGGSCASAEDSSGRTRAVIAELKMEADLCEWKNACAPSTVSPVCPEAGNMNHLQSHSTLLHATSCKEDAGRGREEAEKTGSVSESDSAVCIHRDSIRKRKQEDLPEERTENGREKEKPSKEHSRFSAGEPSLNGLAEKLSSTEVPQGKIQILEAEGKPTPCSRDLQLDRGNTKEMALAGKTTEPVPTESAFPASHVLAQLEAAAAMASHSKKTDADSDDRKFLSAADTDLPGGISADANPEAKTCSAGGDNLSLELELLPDSDLQAVLKDNSLKFPPQQLLSGDTKCDSSAPECEPCAERGQSHLKKAVPVTNTSGPDKLQPSAEVTEGIYDPSPKEDETDVVCGLIAELSNLNRLIMSAHRDLEALKRLKYRKSRRSAKFPPHLPRGAPTTGKKRKDV